MLILVTASQTFGPFAVVNTEQDGWLCDGVKYPHAVIGDATVEPQGSWQPPLAIPSSVTRFQAIAALSNAGLLTQAQNAVNTAGGLTLIAWNNAQEFERASPTIATLAQALNLTSAQVDQLFIAATQITA